MLARRKQFEELGGARSKVALHHPADNINPYHVYLNSLWHRKQGAQRGRTGRAAWRWSRNNSEKCYFCVKRKNCPGERATKRQGMLLPSFVMWLLIHLRRKCLFVRIIKRFLYFSVWRCYKVCRRYAFTFQIRLQNTSILTLICQTTNPPLSASLEQHEAEWHWIPHSVL